MKKIKVELAIEDLVRYGIMIEAFETMSKARNSKGDVIAKTLGIVNVLSEADEMLKKVR